MQIINNKKDSNISRVRHLKKINFQTLNLAKFISNVGSIITFESIWSFMIGINEVYGKSVIGNGTIDQKLRDLYYKYNGTIGSKLMNPLNKSYNTTQNFFLNDSDCNNGYSDDMNL
jgi:hypothetical protein